MSRTALLIALVVSTPAIHTRQAPAAAAHRPAIGEMVTTASGLQYRFTKLGKGRKPEIGDLMVIHGIGAFPDGKEFWNTRSEQAPYEYTLGVDSVIKGFSEGMRNVREGDRIVITMTPDLAYGARQNGNIPPNSTLVFDYEILSVKYLTVAKLLRDGMAAGTVDDAIAKARAVGNLTSYYASASSLQSVASAANRKQAGDGEKVLKFGTSVMPTSYPLYQALGRAQAQRSAVADAISSYDMAIKLNANKTDAERRDYITATTALADLKKR